MDQEVSLRESVVYGSSLNYRIEKFLRKLAGMADLEDALKKLDSLTLEEARMANAEVLRLAHSIRDGVEIVDGKVEEVGAKVQVVIDSARILSSHSKAFLIYTLSDGKQARVAAKDIRDKVSDVGDKVSDVGVKIEDMGDKVQCVDDKVQAVIDGAQEFPVDCQTLGQIILTSRLSDGKQSRLAAKDMGDKLADMGVKVGCVDDKVQVVMDGA